MSSFSSTETRVRCDKRADPMNTRPMHLQPLEWLSARSSAVRCCCRASSPNCCATDAAASRRRSARPEAAALHAARQRVIFLNMSGGVSHVDSFDYKPQLIADHNKSYHVLREDAGGLRAEQSRRRKVLQAPAVGVQTARQVGLWISDLFPHIAECADDLCLIRSMRNDHTDHYKRRSACTPARSRSPGRASARGSATAWAR